MQRTRDLFAVLAILMDTSRQPLVICMTTAGWDRTPIAWELHAYACKVGNGIVNDQT